MACEWWHASYLRATLGIIFSFRLTLPFARFLPCLIYRCRVVSAAALTASALPGGSPGPPFAGSSNSDQFKPITTNPQVLFDQTGNGPSCLAMPQRSHPGFAE